jgi:hypothetical protein
VASHTPQRFLLSQPADFQFRNAGEDFRPPVNLRALHASAWICATTAPSQGVGIPTAFVDDPKGSVGLGRTGVLGLGLTGVLGLGTIEVFGPGPTGVFGFGTTGVLGFGTTGVLGFGCTGGLRFGFAALGGFGLDADGGLGFPVGGGFGLPWDPPGAGAGAPGGGEPAGPPEKAPAAEAWSASTEAANRLKTKIREWFIKFLVISHTLCTPHANFKMIVSR